MPYIIIIAVLGVLTLVAFVVAAVCASKASAKEVAVTGKKDVELPSASPANAA